MLFCPNLSLATVHMEKQEILISLHYNIISIIAFTIHEQLG